jgi:hypothetical protein
MFKAIQFLYKQQVILFLLISSKNALRNQFQSVLIETQGYPSSTATLMDNLEFPNLKKVTT